MSLDLNGGPATPPTEAPEADSIRDPVAFYRSRWEAANRLLKKAEKENETLRTLAQRAKGAEMSQDPAALRAEAEAIRSRIDWDRCLTDPAYDSETQHLRYEYSRLSTAAEDAEKAVTEAAAAKAADVPRWSDGTPKDPWHDAAEVVERAGVDQGFFEKNYDRVMQCRSYLARQARQKEEQEIRNRQNDRARAAGKGKA